MTEPGNMFGKSLLLGVLFLFMWSVNVIAQTEDPKRPMEEKKASLIDNVELELQLGRHRGGGNWGIFGKANHLWWQKKGFQFQSGVAFALFAASERYDAPPTQIRGRSFDGHLQFHTGLRQSFFKKKWLYLGLDAYLGALYLRTKGNYENSNLGISQPYKVSRIAGDYGSRFVLGVQVNPSLGIQLSVNNSWRQAAYGLGLAVGLLAGEVDGKSSFGLGVSLKL